MGIRSPDQRLRVFVSSTLGELLSGAGRAGGSTDAARVAQIRKALGEDRFGELFAAGSRLNQQDAVAAVLDRHGEGARAS